MKQSKYKLKDFALDYTNLAKITWNDKILYDDTLSYYDPCLASAATLNAVRSEYMNKIIYKLNVEVKSDHELILSIQGEE